MNLYNITNEFLNIDKLLEENGGELTPELETQLEVNATNKNHAMRYVLLLRKQKEDEIALVERRIKEWTENKARKDKTKKTYDKLLLRAVIAFGDCTVDEWKISTRKSSSINAEAIEQKLDSISHHCPGMKLSEILEDLESVKRLTDLNVITIHELKELVEMSSKGIICEKVSISPDKKEIKKMIDDGVFVMGAKKQENINLKVN